MKDKKELFIKLLMQKGFGVEGATIAAEQLIAAGVVIPVPCGKCRHWVPEDNRKEYGCCRGFGNKKGIWRRADGYCDKGELK